MYLCAAALIPALVRVVEGPEREGTLGAPPLADEAVSVLFDLTGTAVEEEYDERGYLAASTLQVAAETYRTLFTRIDARLRYLRGEPLSLQHLTDFLPSQYSGTASAANSNLRAITGEDYGFDPEEDLIGNIPAIRAWQERAARPAPVEAGGWAFAGAPLPPPQPLP